MTKLEINIILAHTAGYTVTDVFEDQIYGYKESSSDKVVPIKGVIDFTKDWNLIMPLAINLGAINMQSNPEDAAMNLASGMALAIKGAANA